MRHAARNVIDPSVTVRYVDAAQVSGEGIGLYLISEYTDHAKYRPNTEHWSEYLNRKGVLRSTLLWIHNIEYDFINGLFKESRRLRGVCLYIIETDNEDLQLTGVKRINAGDYITEYDYLSLASRVAAEREDISGLWQRYLADLALELHSGDVEQIVAFVENFEIHSMPMEHRTSITDKAVWKAQLRSAFHLIEEARNAFIKRNEQVITDCLPELQFYQEISNPYDCELGLLCSLTSAKRNDEGKKRLILTYDEYDELHFLHNARNQLAHNKCLTPNEMMRLLG